MDYVEWKHVLKSLCRMPAFLDDLETQLECLDFSDPGLEQPTKFGIGSKAKQEGKSLDAQGFKRKVVRWWA